METIRKYKDPDSTVDFKFDWSEHFADGDTIQSAEILPIEGLAFENVTISNNMVTFWCSGGVVGQRYLITCRVTTAAGRIEDYSFYLEIRQT